MVVPGDWRLSGVLPKADTIIKAKRGEISPTILPSIAAPVVGLAQTAHRPRHNKEMSINATAAPRLTPPWQVTLYLLDV